MGAIEGAGSAARKAWLLPATKRCARVAAVLLALGLVGALVRLLPLALVPGISLAAIAPFARSIAWLAAEVCLLIALPLGVSLTIRDATERGELRALLALGVSPKDALRGLSILCALWGIVLGTVSWLGARDAEAPGRVINQQVEQARDACTEKSSAARGPAPAPEAVPFLTASWLCPPGTAPLLTGRAPVGGVLFSATRAQFSGDLREFTVANATFQKGSVRMHVGEATFRGLPVFVRASPVNPLVRALSVMAATLACVMALVFRMGQASARPLIAIAMGAVGPLSALLVLRGIERITERMPAMAFAAVPAAAFLVSLLAGELAFRLRARKGPDIPT